MSSELRELAPLAPQGGQLKPGQLRVFVVFPVVAEVEAGQQ
jgi:hypothetical protein